MKRNSNIQGLRGALSLFLFFYHVAQSRLPTFEGESAQIINHMLKSLEHGVEIFFGISGIVIFFAFKKSDSVWGFIKNRCLRIFPVLWTTIFVIVVLSNFSSTHHSISNPFVIAANLIAIPTVFSIEFIHPAAWSITYEFAFYAVFVFFACFSFISNRFIATLATIALAALMVSTHLRALPFLIGFIIANIFENTAIAEKNRKTPWPVLSCSGIFVVVSMLAWQASYEAMPNSYNNSADLFRYPVALGYFLIATASVSLALAGIYLGKGWFSRAMRTPLFQWLGLISFSLYLWQTVVMAIVKAAMVKLHIPELAGQWSQILFAIIALPPTLFVSHYSQKLIEDKLTKRLQFSFAKPLAVR